MSWGNTGWDLVDDYESKGSNNNKFGPKKFWVPAQKTKRIMFLDEDPFTFHEHGLWGVNKDSRRKEICLVKNKIAKECPLCDAEHWPSFIGYLTVIDMGDVVPGKKKGTTELQGWTNDQGQTFQFGRKLFGAKRGGKDKPGVLLKLGRLNEKKNGLRGTVWDIYRSGQKVESVGDDFEFVEKVDPENWQEYLINLGANPEFLSLEVIDYNNTFTPSTPEQLGALLGNKVAADSNSKKSSEVSVEKVDLGSDDDDIPFDL